MPDEKIPGFAAKFKAARERLGLRQIDLGDMMGITGFRISNWEIGLSTPPLPLFLESCRKLGCSADYLLGLDPDELTIEERELIRRIRNLGPARIRMIMDMIDHLDDLRPVDG